MKYCLIVDDSRVVRRFAREILRDLDFHTEEAENGSVALELCRRRMPELILLDWNMPIMNGLEFLRALRAEPGGDQPKVVFCTTESELDRIREAVMAGADEYIMKPFDSEIVAGKVAQVGLLDAAGV